LIGVIAEYLRKNGFALYFIDFVRVFST